MSNYPSKVYLNDKILDAKDAKISIFDRGFLFGDGIYEVMVQINGSFFYGQEHLDRLSTCLQKIKIDFDINQLQSKIKILLNATNLQHKDCMIYIQVTRGIAPRKHAYPNNVVPTLFMYAVPFVLPDINQKHMKVITLQDYRWQRCDIKSISLAGNVMANDEAIKNEAYESVFIRDGKVTEASHCNIFFVKNKVLYTHPTNEHILNGITRIIVLQLCNKLGLELKEEAIDANNISIMDEAFLTGTTTQIASIKQIDDHFYYMDDEIGNITKQLQEALLKLKYNNL